MADTFLHGFLNLTAIPKEQIKTLQDGAKGVYIDVHERKQPGQKGDTHYISIRVKDANGVFQTIYLANLKPQTFGLQSPAPAPAPAPQPQQPQQFNRTPNPQPFSAPTDDLPF